MNLFYHPEKAPDGIVLNRQNKRTMGLDIQVIFSKFRRTTAFSLVLLGLTSLIGCTPQAQNANPSAKPAPHEHVFRLNLGSEPPTLDPIRITDLTSMSVLNQLMVGLTRFDIHSQVIPGLATHWTMSADGKSYTFFLNPAAQWEDGQPVTARQVVDGWQRALTPGNGSEYAFFLFDVVGAKAFFEGTKATDFSGVGIHALDAHTLKIALQKPVAFFPALMAFPVGYPARMDIIKRYGDAWTEAGHFPSNGPYRLTEWQHESHLKLLPNPHWWLSPKPQVDGVEMAMVNDANTSMVLYENGQLDFIESPTSLPAFDVRRIRHQPDFKASPLFVIHYFGFNTSKPPFNDVRVRQAFTMALNRSYYPRLLQSGQTVIKGFISPGMTGYDSTVGLNFNPIKAKALLAEAGFPNGKNFPTVILGFRSLYDVRKEAEIAQYLWQKYLGVTVRLANMDWKVYLSRLKSDPPEIFKLNWYVDYPDADSYMSLFVSDNGNNYTRWKSPLYDAGVKAAAAETNQAKRQLLYRQLQQQLLETETVIAPIYTVQKSMLLSPRVSGFEINALNLMDLSKLRMIPEV